MTKRFMQGAMFAICAALVATATAQPASAAVSDGAVRGFDVITDDWNDEGPIGRYHRRFSGATGLWQWVLWADGAIERDGSTFDLSDIDCDFGPNTEHATRSWQGRHGLAADGVVGGQTLGRADDKLYFDRPGEDSVSYRGLAHDNHIVHRNLSNGFYYTDAPGGQGETFLARYGSTTNCWNV